jgi:hypothetical protein
MNTPRERLTQEPRAERGGPGSGEPGSRDTGSDGPSAGPSDRDSGKLDDQEESPDAEVPVSTAAPVSFHPKTRNPPYRPTRAATKAPRRTHALAPAKRAASEPKARRHRTRTNPRPRKKATTASGQPTRLEPDAPKTNADHDRDAIDADRRGLGRAPAAARATIPWRPRRAVDRLPGRSSPNCWSRTPGSRDRRAWSPASTGHRWGPLTPRGVYQRFPIGVRRRSRRP